jgi:hypothetical protein
VTVTPGESTDDPSDDNITHVNGGSGNPNGYDIQNGVIIAIGDNVQIWLTPNSPDGTIHGDHIPQCSDPSQIHYYDSNGNVNGSSSDHTDIFVVGDHTGGYYQQGDWAYDHYEFRPMNNITGNQGVPEGDAGKDYLFVPGDGSDYSVSGVDHPNNHQNNTIDNIQITDGNGSHLIGNANGMEGIVFGDGPSPTLGGDTDITTSITLNVDVDLQSSNSNDHLTLITFSGLPEGAQFSGDYTSVTYDLAHGTYTLTFDENTTHYDGQISVELPEGQHELGDITMEVDSTASDQHDTDFSFNGDEGGQFESGTDTPTSDEHPADSDTAQDDTLNTDHTTDSDQHPPVDTAEDHPTDDNSISTTDTGSDESSTAHDETGTTVDGSNNTTLLVDSEELHLGPVDAGVSTTVSQTEAVDASLNNLLGTDQGSQVADSSTETADHDVPPAENDSTAPSVSQDEPVNFSDIIQDDDSHQDLESLIKAATPNTDPAGSDADAGDTAPVGPPGEGGDDSDGGDGSQDAMDNLIAKPDTDSDS